MSNLKHYPIYVGEYSATKSADWAINTETPPQVGDILVIAGEEMVITERRYIVGGEMAIVVSAPGGRIVR